MDLQPKPLKREIFDKARELGIAEIHLEFQGGSEEGWVYVNCIHSDNSDRRDFHKFKQEIEDWVWQVYDYIGPRDSTGYGDNITYKIVEAVFSDGTWKIPTTSQDWYHQPEYGEKEEFEMGLQSQEEVPKRSMTQKLKDAVKAWEKASCDNSSFGAADAESR